MGRIARAAWDQGVDTVTFWWGSPANLTERAPDEVAAIVAALSDWLDADGKGSLVDARVEVLGRWRELCPPLARSADAAVARHTHGEHLLVCLMGYDGRDEIRDAAGRVGAGADGGAFGRALWTGHLPPVDLVVRTGGEPHLSAGFLLWQIAEARLAFTRTLWPAFTPVELRRVLRAAAATPRRYGR